MTKNSSTKNRFGFALIGLALLLGCGAVWVFYRYPPGAFKGLYKNVLPWTGLLLSCLCFVTGHFSYPRVHNLKVYSFGYLTAAWGLGYFLLYAAPFAVSLPRTPAAYSAILHCLLFVNLVTVVALPSFVSYKTTKDITFGLLIFAIIAVLVFRLVEPATLWAAALARGHRFADWPVYLGPIAAAAGVALGWILMKNDFYLGGVLSGGLVLAALSWCAPLLAGQKAASPLQMLLLTALLLFSCLGMLAHWFSRMEHRVAYDPLLHIYNRDYCSRIMTGQSTLDIRPPFGVAMVDIDHFKKVNDTYGHQAGDAVLIAIASTICKLVVPQGIVCRYGGEELALFFPGMPTSAIVPLMEQVRKSIEAAKIAAGKKRIAVTVSCGVSHRSAATQSIAEVIGSADKALYKAKNEGRNQVKSIKTAL